MVVLVYFANTIVQVLVAVGLARSGPTQAGVKTIANVPDIDVAVAAKLPVPVYEHVGNSGITTLMRIEVS